MTNQGATRSTIAEAGAEAKDGEIEGGVSGTHHVMECPTDGDLALDLRRRRDGPMDEDTARH